MKLKSLFFFFILLHPLAQAGEELLLEKNTSFLRQNPWAQVGVVYAAAWVIYPLTQPSVFRSGGKGSKANYKENFGKIRYDTDHPFWNWGMHPIAGAYYYLAYRNWGHSEINSLLYSFLSSALFELTIEAYSEKPSIQDLYQTPVFGSVLGAGFEWLSLKLYNGPLHYLSYIFNPFLAVNTEKVQSGYFYPSTDFNSQVSLSWSYHF